jgi:hypothetical protein
MNQSQKGSFLRLEEEEIVYFHPKYCNDPLAGSCSELVMMPWASLGPVHQLFQHRFQEHPTNRLPLAEGAVGYHQVLQPALPQGSESAKQFRTA